MERTWMKKRREELKMTMEDVAKRTGYTISYISQIESCQKQNKMTITAAFRLANALDMSVEQIIRNEAERLELVLNE